MHPCRKISSLSPYFPVVSSSPIRALAAQRPMPIPNRLIGRAVKPVNGHAMTLGGIPRIMRAKAATNKANPKVAKRIAWAVPDVGRRARYTLVIAAPRPAAKTIMPMNPNAVPAVARFKLQSPSKAGMTEDVDSRRGCRYGDTGKEYCAHHRRDRDRGSSGECDTHDRDAGAQQKQCNQCPDEGRSNECQRTIDGSGGSVEARRVQPARIQRSVSRHMTYCLALPFQSEQVTGLVPESL